MKKVFLFFLTGFFAINLSAQDINDSLRHKNLGEVVISASRAETLLKNTPEIIQVVNSSTIKLLNPSNLSDILSMIPGINIEGGTGSGFPKRSIINLNGLPANYSLVLVNGVRLLSDHIHTGQNVEFVPAENIERIEIIRGAASSQYGSDALGGIINIITNKSKSTPEVSIYSSLGTYKTYTAGINVLCPVNKNFRISSYTGWEKSDGPDITYPVNRVGKMNYERMVLMNSVDFDITKRFNGSAYINLMRNKMIWTDGNKYGFLFNPGLNMKYNIIKDLHLAFNMNYVHWESEQNTEKNQFIEPEILLNYSGIKNNSMLFGVDFRQNYFTRKAVASHHQYTGGFFIQDEYRFGDKLAAMIALRLDKAENINPVFSPKATLLYKPLRQLNIRFSAGRGFHAPLLFELYEVAYGHGGSALRFGNENLKPEYSTSFNLAMEVYPLRNVMIMANGYFSMIDDMIVPVYKGPWQEDTTKDIWMRENIETAYVYGAEISARVNFLKSYSFETGYAYSGNQNPETSRQLPYSPGSSVYGKLLFDQAIGKYIRLGGFAECRAVFNRSAWNWKPPSSESRDFQDGLVTQLANYQKLDAGISITLLDHYSFYFNIYNILGQEIETLDDAFTVFEGEPTVRGGIKIRF